MSKQKSPKAEIQHAQKEGLEKEISPKVDIETSSQEQRREVKGKLSYKKHYSGLLPDGENIKIYNEVIPNGGDRLMKTVEKQVSHRIEMEKTVREEPLFNQYSTGQWMGFIIAIALGFIAWHLAMKGHAVVASILGGADLAALVAVFIIRGKAD